MTDNKPTTQPKPKGKPLRAQVVDREARITPSDKASAVALWERLAPPELKGLLRAKGK